MMRARTIGAALLTTSAALLLLVEALSWSSSARFGPLSSTTLPCGIRLDNGDLVLLDRMDPASRTAAVFHYTPTQAGTAGETIRVAIQRGAQTKTVAFPLRQTDSVSTFVAQMAFKL